MRGAALVLGATSGIGAALARQLASEGYDLILAGRREEALATQVRDLEVRYGVRATAQPFEALDFDGHAGLIEACAKWSPSPDGLRGVVLCQGTMPEEGEAARRFDVARHMIDVNYTSAVSVLDRAAEFLEARGSGWICAVTSVAGDRGRASNFHYGSTKAALSTYLSGLRVRLARVGVAVVDVRPGMIDTALTYGLPNLMLVAPPETVAADACRAIRRGRGVVYTPWFWRIIMTVIRLLPGFVFKRLDL